jgi:hypothetical protein
MTLAESGSILPVTSMALRAEIQGSFTPFRMTNLRVQDDRASKFRMTVLEFRAVVSRVHPSASK